MVDVLVTLRMNMHDTRYKEDSLVRKYVDNYPTVVPKAFANHSNPTNGFTLFTGPCDGKARNKSTAATDATTNQS